MYICRSQYYQSSKKITCLKNNKYLSFKRRKMKYEPFHERSRQINRYTVCLVAMILFCSAALLEKHLIHLSSLCQLFVWNLDSILMTCNSTKEGEVRLSHGMDWCGFCSTLSTCLLPLLFHYPPNCLSMNFNSLLKNPDKARGGSRQ